LTSREFNGQPYGQDPHVSAPVSVSTAFAMSNLATFVKEPLYKSTPRRANKRRSDREDTEITTPRQGEGVQPPSPSPSISPPHSHSHRRSIRDNHNLTCYRVCGLVVYWASAHLWAQYFQPLYFTISGKNTVEDWCVTEKQKAISLPPISSNRGHRPIIKWIPTPRPKLSYRRYIPLVEPYSLGWRSSTLDEG
jgi:hypothetical protein